MAVPRLVSVQGHKATARGASMIAEAQRLGGALTITQGSYSTSVAASAGTHGLEGFDFSVRGLTRTQVNRRVRALRRVGFAAWHRLPAEGPWPAHIHAVPVGGLLTPAAARQVEALRAGRNGLANGGPDRHAGMKLPVITWEHYLRQKAEDDVTPADIRAIADAVWAYQINHNKPGARVNSDNPSDKDNPKWRALSVVEDAENRLRVLEDKVDRLLAQK